MPKPYVNIRGGDHVEVKKKKKDRITFHFTKTILMFLIIDGTPTGEGIRYCTIKSFEVNHQLNYDVAQKRFVNHTVVELMIYFYDFMI